MREVYAMTIVPAEWWWNCLWKVKRGSVVSHRHYLNIWHLDVSRSVPMQNTVLMYIRMGAYVGAKNAYSLINTRFLQLRTSHCIIRQTVTPLQFCTTRICEYAQRDESYL